MKLDKECTQNPEEKTVVDERCLCGHLKSKHRPRVRPSGHIEREIGSCDLCPCERFVFMGWIFSDGSET